MELAAYVQDFAAAMKRVDATRPQGSSSRSDRVYQPGIGPHSEDQTVTMVMANLSETSPKRYGAGTYSLQTPYPSAPRSKLDVAFGSSPNWTLCVEVKMLRLMGDNGKVNDNMLMHVLSPYPQHRSALTDTQKLVRSGFPGQKALLIFAYEYADFPSRPAIDAFETLARLLVKISPVPAAAISGLVHPIHTEATVYGWTIGTGP